MLTPSVGNANRNGAFAGDFGDSRLVIGNFVLSSLTGYIPVNLNLTNRMGCCENGTSRSQNWSANL